MSKDQRIQNQVSHMTLIQHKTVLSCIKIIFCIITIVFIHYS